MRIPVGHSTSRQLFAYSSAVSLYMLVSNVIKPSDHLGGTLVMITRCSTVRDPISFQDGGNHLYIWGIIRARNFHRVSVTVAPQWKWSRLFGHIYSNLCRCCREVFTGVESLDDTPCTYNAPYREKKGRCSNSHICSYKYRTPSSKTHPSIGI